MNTIEVVVAQSPAELTDRQVRFDWLEQSLKLDIMQGADLLLLPELFLTGYNIGAKIKEWSEPEDGLYAEKISTLCQKYNIAIHYGYAENYQDKIYNSANCINSEGIRLAGHRKLLLPPGFEADYFSGGDNFETFTINGFKIATLICYDAEFPENFRQVAQLGVGLVLVPTALSSQWDVVADKVIPSRAFENGVFVCYANQAGNEHGLEYLGASCIIGPDGTELQRAGNKSQFLRATLSQAQVTKAQQRLPYLKDMRRLSELFIGKMP